MNSESTMLLAKKEAVMTVLNTVNFVAFNPLQNNNPVAVRRRKLVAKINEQIQFATDKDYTPTQHKWITDADGKLSNIVKSTSSNINGFPRRG